MALPEQRVVYSVEEYLALERQADERHQYLDGEIFEMSGESLAHSRIGINFLGELHSQLKGKPCEALSPNMKVRSGPYLKGQRNTKGLFSYADLTVVCGQPLFHDEHQDVLLNPTVIVEVLSPSTSDFDHGEKFFRYRQWIDTLADYVLAWQSAPLIEHYQRQPGGTWLLKQTEGLDASLYLASIDSALKLGDIYDRVSFPPPDALLTNDEETGIAAEQ